MEKFAGYGFNKSHAAAYALVAYQTAYLKAHHPAAFMAANLSAVMDDTDKVQQLCRGLRCERARRCCRRTSTRAATASCRSTRRRSATAWARSRAPARARSRHIIAARAAGGPFTRPVRFLPPRRQAHRQPARGRGAGARRRVRRAERRPGDVARKRRQSDRSRRHVPLAQRGRRACSARSKAMRGHVDYVQAARWSEREKPVERKARARVTTSRGHLFTEFAAEARRLAPTRLADCTSSAIGAANRVHGWRV